MVIHPLKIGENRFFVKQTAGYFADVCNILNFDHLPDLEAAIQMKSVFLKDLTMEA